MKSDTREAIMAVARKTVQAHGYNGLSFRELAKEIERDHINVQPV